MRRESKEKIILEYIKKNPGVSIMKIATDLKITYPTVHKWIKILEARGIITLREFGNQVIVNPRR
ncbi:MAG: winged helix-turn-helix transcriptional regulator [Candidatus Aenigmatarchaeota archaeon]